MESYAKLKGLNVLETRREFHNLDKDNDGSIGKLELVTLGMQSAQELLEQSKAVARSIKAQAKATAEDDLIKSTHRFVPDRAALNQKVPPAALLAIADGGTMQVDRLPAQE